MLPILCLKKQVGSPPYQCNESSVMAKSLLLPRIMHTMNHWVRQNPTPLGWEGYVFVINLGKYYLIQLYSPLNNYKFLVRQ